MSDVEITIQENGPLLVEGDPPLYARAAVEASDASGKEENP